jgi:hypothetical protein
MLTLRMLSKWLAKDWTTVVLILTGAGIFHFATTSVPTLVTIESPSQCGQSTIPLGVEWPEREPHLHRVPRLKVWSFTFVLPIHLGSVLKHRDSLNSACTKNCYYANNILSISYFSFSLVWGLVSDSLS